MRWNRETEIDWALHQVRLAEQGKEKESGREKGGHGEDAMTGQINQLSSYRQTENQGDDWQPLTHSSRIGSSTVSPNYKHVSCKTLALLPCVSISQRFSV